MPKFQPRPEDANRPPSPLLVNYVEFGERLTPQEWGEVFCGDRLWLRRVAELAVQKYMPASLPTPHDSHSIEIPIFDSEA